MARRPDHGLPIQKEPLDPGRRYANLVAVPWLADGVVLVIASRHGAFAVMSNRFSRSVSRQQLTVVTRVYARQESHPEVTSTRIVFATDAVPVIEDSSTQSPPEAPEGWFSQTARRLREYDCDSVHDSDATRVRAGIHHRADKLLDAYTRTQVDGQHGVLDQTRLTSRVSGATSSGAPARLVIKSGSSIVGRLLLPSGVLLVPHEEDRETLTSYVRGLRYEVQPPIRGWDRLPTHIAHVSYVGAWGVYKLVLGATDDENALEAFASGLYFPKEKKLMTLFPQWDKALSEVVERLGLPVGGTLGTAPPPGYSPDLFEKLGTNQLRSAPSSLPDTRQKPATRSTASKAASRRGESRTRRAKASKFAPPQQLGTVHRDLVPSVVADAWDEWVPGTLHGDRYQPHTPGSRHLWWTWRSSALKRVEINRLSRATPRVELPPQAADAIEWAGAISPDHLLLLAAYRLRIEAPVWWSELPWKDGPRLRASARSNSDFQRSLRELSAEQARDTGQPLLVEKFRRSGGVPECDSPSGFSQDDKARLYITAGALARAGYGRSVPSVDYWSLSTCLICQRSYSRAAFSLDTLVYARTARVCHVCLDGARLRAVDSAWTDLRVRGAQEAIRRLGDDAGGPPSPQLLAASFPWATEEELVRAVILRSVLPTQYYSDASKTAGRPKWSWTEWLNHSGLLESGWRPSFGVHSIATDGHYCRSLFERYLDDWLSSRGIIHSTEPSYPYDEDLNPHGMRADWLIDDVYVEAAGLMGQSDYANKMANKEQLAAKHNLEVLIVLPDEITKLDRKFARWFPRVGPYS